MLLEFIIISVLAGKPSFNNSLSNKVNSIKIKWNMKKKY